MEWDKYSHFRFLEEVTFEPVLQGWVGDSKTRKEGERTSQADRAEDTAPTIHFPEAPWGLLCEEHLWVHKCARTGSGWYAGAQGQQRSFACGLEGQGLSRQGKRRWQAWEATLAPATESQSPRGNGGDLQGGSWNRKGEEGRVQGLEREVNHRGHSKELGLYPGVPGSHRGHLSKRGFISF